MYTPMVRFGVDYPIHNYGKVSQGGGYQGHKLDFCRYRTNLVKQLDGHL